MNGRNVNEQNDIGMLSFINQQHFLGIDHERICVVDVLMVCRMRKML